jgi:hypothetical protein
MPARFVDKVRYETARRQGSGWPARAMSATPRAGIASSHSPVRSSRFAESRVPGSDCAPWFQLLSVKQNFEHLYLRYRRTGTHPSVSQPKNRLRRVYKLVPQLPHQHNQHQSRLTERIDMLTPVIFRCTRSAQATSRLCGRISASMAASACKLWRSREMVTVARVRPPFLYATAQSRASRLPSISIASHFSAWPT